MRILDTYFRKGAPSAATVPLSDLCRASTLKFRASSAFIFDRARGELLERMGVEKVQVSACCCSLWGPERTRIFQHMFGIENLSSRRHLEALESSRGTRGEFGGREVGGEAGWCLRRD